MRCSGPECRVTSRRNTATNNTTVRTSGHIRALSTSSNAAHTKELQSKQDFPDACESVAVYNVTVVRRRLERK